MKNLKEIDKFYYAATAVSVLIAILIILVFRGIFSAVTVAYEVEQQEKGKDLKIDTENLDKAYKLVYEKKGVNTKELTVTPTEVVENE